MKGAIFGAVGVCGVGAAVVGGGGGGPDDFVAVVSKPPSAVYAAFADIGPPGDKTEIVPKKGGYAAKLTRRVIKVPNEQVKFEFLIDDEALLTAEVQMSAEGSGTRLAPRSTSTMSCCGGSWRKAAPNSRCRASCSRNS
jgi:hypothetical protein